MIPIAFAVLAGLFWGIGELCAKSALKSHEIGPLTAIAVRTVVALPIIGLVWWTARQSWLEPVGVAAARETVPLAQASTPTLVKIVLGAGVCAGALGLICFYMGISAGDISKVKPIAFALAPAIAVVGGCALLGEPWSAQKVAAVGLILAGVVLLTSAK